MTDPDPSYPTATLLHAEWQAGDHGALIVAPPCGHKPATLRVEYTPAKGFYLTCGYCDAEHREMVADCPTCAAPFEINLDTFGL